jgi:DUF1680 family protein
MRKLTIAFVGLIAAGPFLAAAPQSNDAERANLAIVATPSTSYVSPHETLEAINDGAAPKRSNDTTHGGYGNWPQRGTQWIEYQWAKAVTINRTEVYWYIDGRGLHAPASAKVQYWDDAEWKDVKGGQVGLEANRFNAVSFEPITTTRLRLEMVRQGEFSTGVLEWRVIDAGTSPDFPAKVQAGSDRVLVLGGVTHLNGEVRSTGKPGQKLQTRWSKLSGPGEVEFADAAALNTTAKCSAPGTYELKLASHAGDLESSDTIQVRVEPALPVADVMPVNLSRYRINSPFWNPRIKALIVNWIPHCVAQLEKPDLKEGGLENIIEAGNKLAGKPAKPHVGAPWANAYVLNTVEAMSIALLVDANGDREIASAQDAMRKTLDQWIPLLLAAQEPDGYFQTRFTLATPRERERGQPPQHWDPRLRGEHEGYVAGYFLEAAIAHYRATDGKDRRLYDAAKKLADCWNEHLGPAPKKAWFDGHEEIELALFRFARLVDEVEGSEKGKKYEQLSKFLLDCRGHGGSYDQSHVPVTEQYSAEGHAVRAAYAYTAMAEVAKSTGDIAYQSAVRSLFDNLINRKRYLTGGIGSGETSEGFGHDYSLPNNAYCESCAGAGMVFFQQRMHALYGDASYADLYEDTLYNAVLSDIDLKGENFTYTNSLDTDQARYKWHDCPCCVGNIPRTLLSLPAWTYARRGDGIDVNLFIGSEMTVGEVAGTNVSVSQTTNYPWDGKVSIAVKPQEERKFKLRIRVPNRGASQLYPAEPAVEGLRSLSVNGEALKPTIENGYAVIDRTWRSGDRVELELPLAVQRVHANEKVKAARDRVALRYGPLIYNFEAVDQNLDGVLAPDAPLQAEWSPDLLGGVVAINGKFADGSPLQAIPNYARNNRGGRSIVWIRER